jgi:putative spermidine/putrescine transport system permease protein
MAEIAAAAPAHVTTIRPARARVSPVAWLVGPALLLFILFFVLPFGVMALLSFLSGNPATNPNVFLTTRHYERFLGDSLYFEALWATLRIGIITTAAALLIGYPLAHWMARMHSRVCHASWP